MQNLQGDIIQIIDANGTVVVEYTYDAWGKVLNVTGDDNLKNTLGKVQPFRYRGYVYDVETGLYYLRSRYYNSESDRFINGDIILANNTYCYCQNDPVKQKDDQGTLPEDNTTANFDDSVTELMRMFLQCASDYHYLSSGTSPDGGIDCAYLVRKVCDFIGEGATSIWYHDFQKKRKRRGRIEDLEDGFDSLQPGWIVYQVEKGTYDSTKNPDKVTMSHVGVVVYHDFNDGRGKRLAVFHSASEVYTEKKGWSALFYDDIGGGPNISGFYSEIEGAESSLWKYYSVPNDL